MTVRNYETKFCPCEICCEPAECATVSVGLELRVEGGPLVPFAVCELCVGNMMRPFRRYSDE